MISKNLGHYDWVHPHEQQWHVSLRLPVDAPHRYITQTWNEDDEPDIADLPPSEVAELIVAKTETYLFSSRMEEHREMLDWIHDNAERLDAKWATMQIDRHQRQIADIQKRIGSLRRVYCTNVAVTEEA